MITDLAAKGAKPKEKSYRLRDDRGLYLRVDPNGKKYWVLRYWENKKERQMSLGPYPAVSIREARERRDTIQNARARGEPVGARKVVLPTFEAVVREWLAVRMGGKSDKYLKTIRLRLDKYLLPALGDHPIDAVTSGDVLRLCRKVEGLGHIETAHRVKVLAGQVFRFAIAAGYVENDPTVALSGALRPSETRHMPTLTDPAQIGLLYRAMREYPFPVMRAALLFSLLTFARPGEVRAAEWVEMRGDVWDIPAGKMKMKRRHLVPLSRQAQAVLEELREVTGRGRWLFPSARSDGRCMSENGVRMALRALGYGKETLVPHGFRGMASTVFNENGWSPDVIERQLAHAERNAVRGAYNHAEYWEERVRLMQWWADWLEGLGGAS